MRECSKCGGKSNSFEPSPGVRIFLCSSCGGVFFPIGMLAALLKTESDLPPLSTSAVTNTQFTCKSCGRGKFLVRPYKDGVPPDIDLCDSCGGIFLDFRELSLLQNMVKTSIAAGSGFSPAPLRSPQGSLPHQQSSMTALDAILANRPEIFVKQRKEWTEIIVNMETRNKYDVYDGLGMILGHVAEAGSGLGYFFRRQILGTHRGFEATLWDAVRTPILRFNRPFYWFFSDIFIQTASGEPLGSVHRRFAWFTAIYDLRTHDGQTFARVHKPFWRVWRFPIVNGSGQEIASIVKRWGGVLREAFSSADTFQIDFGGQPWPTSYRAVILAAALTIDFDAFETQSKGRGNGLDIVSNIGDMMS